jgi:hypothetical protein
MQWNTSKNTFCFVIDSSTTFPAIRKSPNPRVPPQRPLSL